MTVSATCATDEISLHSAAIDSYDYDAFGNKINSTGTTPNNFLYRGEEFDPDLGLYYLRARYMNPLTGRFMSRDPEDGKPIDPKTLHKYLYAGGDPVNTKDPTGRESILEEGAIDHDFILETLPTVIEYACTVEFAWGLVAESTNLVAEILTWNKEYEPVWTPPRPLTVLCGWKEFGGGGSGGGGSE